MDSMVKLRRLLRDVYEQMGVERWTLVPGHYGIWALKVESVEIYIYLFNLFLIYIHLFNFNIYILILIYILI
jgi:hypothetical protein